MTDNREAPKAQEAGRAEHSQAPWTAARLDAATHEEMIAYIDGTVRMGDNVFYLVIGTHDDGRPADICHTGNGVRSAWNALLISAAPDMLEALRAADDALCNASEGGRFYAGAIGKVQSAIAKATGIAPAAGAPSATGDGGTKE